MHSSSLTVPIKCGRCPRAAKGRRPEYVHATSPRPARAVHATHPSVHGLYSRRVAGLHAQIESHAWLGALGKVRCRMCVARHACIAKKVAAIWQSKRMKPLPPCRKLLDPDKLSCVYQPTRQSYTAQLVQMWFNSSHRACSNACDLALERLDEQCSVKKKNRGPGRMACGCQTSDPTECLIT